MRESVIKIFEFYRNAGRFLKASTENTTEKFFPSKRPFTEFTRCSLEENSRQYNSS